ncbi:MAG TPA: KpsF/GutQ family sugar-phosphate isomerase [Rhizomicrobium sp.]|jgi:arabinose-5-phosphate isomerase|nr:KpsF/GutQ family sugar-phosphate isomerase [Rhizomicrobium sp.]
MRSSLSASSAAVLKGNSASSAVEGDLVAARRVIGSASDAIAEMGNMLDGAFSEAVDLLMQCSGRVIVSGMGKSGHIARKIAATLASTGTPAHFVHPAEASHGDLGAVTRADALLVLSNSGETAELKDLLTFAKRFSVPLIGVAARSDSALLRAADVALLLPQAREACPMGLAPTTSTTLMLVLGDALAVALMERRGFTPDQYRELHPGGSLGKSLLRVQDIMHGESELPLVPRETVLRDVVQVMTEKRFGCAGVIDDTGRLIGIFTDGDLRRAVGRINDSARIAEFMTKKPKVATPADLAAQAVAVMNSHNINVLFVIDPSDGSQNPVGILHLHDCLRAGLQ